MGAICDVFMNVCMYGQLLDRRMGSGNSFSTGGSPSVHTTTSASPARHYHSISSSHHQQQQQPKGKNNDDDDDKES